MKKMIYISVLFLIATGGIFWSCQKDEIPTNLEEELMLKGAKAKVVANENEFVFEENACIDVTHTFTLNSAIKENLGIQAELSPGNWTSIGQLSKSTENSTTFEYLFETEGVFQLRYKIGSGGYTNGFYIKVKNCSSCDESFSYVKNENGTYTFTLIPAEDMDDAKIVFTFAQGSYVSGLDGWDNNGVTYQKNINLIACESVSWTVELQSNCKGNGQENANVWTDFTINDSSKKGDNDNIILPCAE